MARGDSRGMPLRCCCCTNRICVKCNAYNLRVAETGSPGYLYAPRTDSSYKRRSKSSYRGEWMDNCWRFQFAAFGQCSQGDSTTETWSIRYVDTDATLIYFKVLRCSSYSESWTKAISSFQMAWPYPEELKLPLTRPWCGIPLFILTHPLTTATVFFAYVNPAMLGQHSLPPARSISPSELGSQSARGGPLLAMKSKSPWPRFCWLTISEFQIVLGQRLWRLGLRCWVTRRQSWRLGNGQIVKYDGWLQIRSSRQSVYYTNMVLVPKSLSNPSNDRNGLV